MLAAVGSAPMRAEVSREYQLKAAFLYNFAKFVEWPAARFEGADAPIVIGVMVDNPFEDELEKAINGRQAGGRSLVVRRVTSGEEARGVHLLFVPAAQEARFAEWTESLAGAAVLTVGESGEFSGRGGVIAFVREADKVRFAVNLEAADAHRLKISAQLLKLAVAVHRKP
jgi:hypothetical protein